MQFKVRILQWPTFLSVDHHRTMTNHAFDIELDTRGLRCPEPVMMLHQAIRGAAAGACIKVVATDPATERDIPKFCSFLGHRLVEKTGAIADVYPDANPDQPVYVYWVVKKTPE